MMNLKKLDPGLRDRVVRSPLVVQKTTHPGQFTVIKDKDGRPGRTIDTIELSALRARYPGQVLVLEADQ